MKARHFLTLIPFFGAFVEFRNELRHGEPFLSDPSNPLLFFSSAVYHGVSGGLLLSTILPPL